MKICFKDIRVRFTTRGISRVRVRGVGRVGSELTRLDIDRLVLREMINILQEIYLKLGLGLDAYFPKKKNEMFSMR